MISISKISVLSFAIIALFFTACEKGKGFDCFKSTGREIVETRFTEAFDSIEVNDKLEVTIHSGPQYKVEIHAGEHIISKISSKVKDGMLTLKNLNTCNFVRGYKRTIRIDVTTPDLKKLNNNGVGPVTFAEDFHQDKLYVRVENSGDMYINGTFKELRTSTHGNGDIYLNGSSQDLLIYTYGTNFIQAENFRVSGYLFISTFSIGDARFNLDGLGLFEYYIWDAGNIYYRGNPGIIKNSGESNTKGQLISLN